MKASQKQFTSVADLLTSAGHRAFRVKLEYSVGNIFRNNTDYIWFPGLQIIVMAKNNKCIQLRQEKGLWYSRLGKKSMWNDILSRPGGIRFVKLIEPIYARYLNDLMMGDVDVKPERSGLQGSNC